MQSVASALLGDDVLLRLHAQGLMIILKDGEVDVADKEAINLLRWMRRHHLSIRALKGCMRTTCTWDHVMAMRKTLTPYLSKGRVLEVATKGGTRTCGVVELHDIVTTMVACAHAEDSIRKYEDTLLWKGGDRHWETSQGQRPHMGFTRSSKGCAPFHF